MATIVDIRDRAAARSARAQGTRQRGSADILLFTGVQYERWSERQQQADAARRRDRLELED